MGPVARRPWTGGLFAIASRGATAPEAQHASMSKILPARARFWWAMLLNAFQRPTWASWTHC
eukprot:10192577-Lingulodinium_polyedra.AAC.1